MAWSDPTAPHELLDDGFAPDPCDLLVIGCGNILRGDDAVGPVLVRHLFERGVPDGVRLVDGGTAGMDVAFGMRGASRVVIVDAAATGAEPGTVYRVPAEELAQLPPIDGLHTHNFRWDHALSFSSWLLGPERPDDVTVYLVEAGSTEPGAPLSPPVEAAMRRVIELVERDHYPDPPVELTGEGYLHVPARLAAHRFPGDVLVARMEGTTLVLVPLVSASHGGLVLKQRNAAGDRSVLVHEVMSFTPVPGRFDVTWDTDRGALLVPLAGGGAGDRGADRGGAGARPVGGLPGGAEPGRGGAAAARDASDGGAGPAGGRRGPQGGGAPEAAAGGER